MSSTNTPDPPGKPAPPPEAVLISLRRDALRVTVRDLWRRTKISPSWISQVEAGSRLRGGRWEPVVIADRDLAAIADALGITPDALREAGRSRAADVLVLRQEPQPAAGGDPVPPMPPMVREIAREHGLNPAWLWGQPDFRHIFTGPAWPDSDKRAVAGVYAAAVAAARDEDDGPGAMRRRA